MIVFCMVYFLEHEYPPSSVTGVACVFGFGVMAVGAFNGHPPLRHNYVVLIWMPPVPMMASATGP